MQKGIDCIGIAVAFFCHDGKGNVLMSLRSKNARDEHGKWDIGAGGIEFGDKVEETLAGEIQQEYGADIIHAKFLGYRTVFREHNSHLTHWVMLDFKVQINPAQVKNGEPHKFDEVRWFPFNAMPRPEEMHSQIPNFIKKNQQYLV